MKVGHLNHLIDYVADADPRPTPEQATAVAVQMCEAVGDALTEAQLMAVGAANANPASDPWECASAPILEAMDPAKDLDDLLGEGFFNATGREFTEDAPPLDEHLFNIGYLAARRHQYDGRSVHKLIDRVYWEAMERAKAKQPATDGEPAPALSGDVAALVDRMATDPEPIPPVSITAPAMAAAPPKVWTVGELLDGESGNWEFLCGAVVLDGTPIPEVLATPAAVLASAIWGRFVIHEDRSVAFLPDPGMHEDETTIALDRDTPVLLLARNQSALRSLFAWIRDGKKPKAWNPNKFLDIFRGKDQLRPVLSDTFMVGADHVGAGRYYATTDAHSIAFIDQAYFEQVQGSDEPPVNVTPPDTKGAPNVAAVTPMRERWSAERPTMPALRFVIAAHQCPNDGGKAALAINRASFGFVTVSKMAAALVAMRYAPDAPVSLAYGAAANRIHIFLIDRPIVFGLMPTMNNEGGTGRHRFTYAQDPAPVQG